ncbi:[Wnt protein] O-palmitoleoyl-L-serine hydrolase [Ranunculus cassubicifolius]
MRLCTLRTGNPFSERSWLSCFGGSSEILSMTYVVLKGYLYDPIDCVRPDGPAAPGKRIEEASDSFMHAPLGSGGYSSVGRAPLLQLGRCDYGLDV